MTQRRCPSPPCLGARIPLLLWELPFLGSDCFVLGGGFVAPCIPCMAGEKLDPRKIGIHAFDKFIGFVGFAAVLAARGLDNGAGAICWRGSETRPVARSASAHAVGGRSFP